MDTVSCPSRCKEQIRQFALECGFSACGFAESGLVDSVQQEAYARWIADGMHSEMRYLENHEELRKDPASLLDGVKTVISLAANYYPRVFQPAGVPQFSYYAYGKDYHEVVRAMLLKVATRIKELAGGDFRVCVDTAPIRERYWAQRAGIGFIGRNNQLIIPGKGSYFFLGEILTTIKFSPDKPIEAGCGNCHRCVSSCPTGALPGDFKALDARKCISCQTIESRASSLPDFISERLGNRIYGCDTCQKVCPHNVHATATSIEEFTPSEQFLSLTSESLSAMTESDFRTLFRYSAVKRAKYSGLQRNLHSFNR